MKYNFFLYIYYNTCLKKKNYFTPYLSNSATAISRLFETCNLYASQFYIYIFLFSDYNNIKGSYEKKSYQKKKKVKISLVSNSTP